MSKELKKDWWRNQMKTKSYFGLFILVLAVFFFISSVSAALIQSSVWNENEIGYPLAGSTHEGQWIRRPGTDTFDAKWPSSADSDVIVLTSIAGNKIAMHRNTHNGDYTGTISSDGKSITGIYTPIGRGWTETWEVSVTDGTVAGGGVSPGTGTTTQPTKKGCTGSGTSIYVDDRTMNPGQEVVIPIMMCNANDIANMDLSVGYDNSALQFKDAVKGSLNSNVLFESNNVGSTVKIAFAGKSGFSGSGSIAVLTFKVTGRNGASSPITVTVGSASTSGGKSVTIPVNNGNVVIGNTNPNNPGGRDKVTSLDALIALQISVGKRVNDSNYDLTKDGTVNSNDAREILKLAVQ